MTRPVIKREFEELSKRIDDLENRLKREDVQLGHRQVFTVGRKGEVPAPTESDRGRVLGVDGWFTLSGSGGGGPVTGSGTPDGHTLAMVTGVLNAEPLSGTIDARIKNLSGTIDGHFNSLSFLSSVSHDTSLTGLGTGGSPLSASPVMTSLQTGFSASFSDLSGTVNSRFIRGKTQVYTGTGVQTIPLDLDTAVLAVKPTADLFMIGMTSGTDGRVVEVYNSGTANAFIYDNHASANALDRFSNGLAGGFGYLVSGGGMGVAVYDGAAGKWRFGWHLQANTPTSLTVLGDVSPTGNVFASYRLKGGTTRLSILPSPYTDLTNGTKNNWNPHSGSPSGFPVYAFGIVEVTVATGNNTITGLDATFAASGDLVVILNRTGYDMVFNHQDTGSTAPNRFYLSQTGPITVGTGGSISFRYISTSVGWQQVAVTSSKLFNGQTWTQTANGTEGTTMTAVIPVPFAGPQYQAFVTNFTGSNSPVFKITNKTSGSFQIISTAPFASGDKVDIMAVSGGLGPMADVNAIAVLSGTIDARFINLSGTIDSRFANFTSAVTGTLSMTLLSGAASLNVSTEGNIDWVVPFNSARISQTSFPAAHGKVVGGWLLSSLEPVGGGGNSVTLTTFTSQPTITANNDDNISNTALSANNGSRLFVTTSVSGDLNWGFRFRVPSTTTTRVCRIYTGHFSCQIDVSASLADGSAPAVALQQEQVAGASARKIWTIAYNSSTQSELIVRIRVSKNNLSGTANVGIVAVTLSSSTGF